MVLVWLRHGSLCEQAVLSLLALLLGLEPWPRHLEPVSRAVLRLCGSAAWRGVGVAQALGIGACVDQAVLSLLALLFGLELVRRRLLEPVWLKLA